MDRNDSRNCIESPTVKKKTKYKIGQRSANLWARVGYPVFDLQGMKTFRSYLHNDQDEEIVDGDRLCGRPAKNRSDDIAVWRCRSIPEVIQLANDS